MSPRGDDASGHSTPSIEANSELENLPIMTPPESPTPPNTTPPSPIHIPQLIQLPIQLSPLYSALDFDPFALIHHDAVGCLPIDHNLPAALRQACGTEDLLTVETLTLTVVSLQMSLQRLAIFVPNLTELILDNSCILSLRDIGCDFKFLQKLSVVNCGLDSLDGCFAFTDLKEFRAGKNEIKDVGQSMFMDSVRILDFQGNPVKDIMCLKFLVMCEELEELNLVDCPATLEPDYRDIVASILPKLKVLDGIPIEDSERGWPHESDDEDEEDDQDRGDGAGKSSESTDETNTRGDVPNNSGDSSSKSTNSQNVNSSTFGDFNTGCRKIILPPIKERPTSAVSKTTLFKKELRKNRPATANSRMINTDFNIQKARVKIFLPSDKTHSSKLYENSRKEKSENSQNKLEKISVELKQKSLQMNAVKCCNNTKYKTFSNSVDSLVNASRKWRQVYNVYRSQRRERWFQELQDDLSLDYMERKEEDSYDTDISNKINTAALQICSVDTIHTCTIPTSLC